MFKLYNLTSFNTYMHTWNHHHHHQDNEPIWHPLKVPSLPSTTPIPGNPPICFLSLEISWHFLEFYINWITYLTCSVFCVFFLGLTSFMQLVLRSIRVIACMISTFFFSAEKYPVTQMYHSEFIQSLDEHKDYLQVLVITNRALMHQFALTCLREIPVSRIAEL